MEISNIQHVMLRHLNRFSLIVIALAMTPMLSFAQGEALFKSKCSSCHQVHKNGTGPKLAGAKQRWADAGEAELIVKWVQNNAELRAGGKSKRAADVFKEYGGSQMTVFADLTADQVNSILDFADSQPEDSGAEAKGNEVADAADGETEEDGSMGFIWLVMAIIFVIIILSAGGVRRQLIVASSGDESLNKLTYFEEFKALAWKYRAISGLVGLALVISFIVILFQDLYTINIMEGYQPSQPIAFPHSRHAGENAIDCKYCHNSVTKSRSAGLPSVNVCMNCHKQINGQGKPFEGEINKIYAAAGWDTKMGPAGGYKHVKNAKPIVWNKVHVLPDHVYFNHSQHVVVGGIDCKQCHGDMAAMKETAMVQPVEELNKIEGNIKLTRPTLTMGWCIECHGAKGVSIGDGKNGYYDEIHSRLKKNKTLYKKYLDNDGKITVNELGGWECAKCHY